MTTRQMAREMLEAAEAVRQVSGTVMVPGKTVYCPLQPIQVPGITSADALDALDVVGVPFFIRTPRSGVITGAKWYDPSDQGSSVRVHLFRAQVTAAASDAAWSPADDVLTAQIEVLTFTTFEDEINGQASYLDGLVRGYSAPLNGLWVVVTTPAGSTPTYTTPAFPLLQLVILSDDPNYTES